MTKVICALAAMLLLATLAAAQDNDDGAIKATALNYIEGWYEGMCCGS